MSALAVYIDGVWSPSAKGGRGRDAGSEPVKGRLAGQLTLAGLYVDNKPPQPEEPPAGGGGGEHVDNTLPGDLPHPAHPIELPPNPAPGTEVEIKLKAVWDQENGWQTVVVIVPSGDRPTVTPSRK